MCEHLTAELAALRERVTEHSHNHANAEHDLERARALLTRWVEAADRAKDMTFVPVCFATKAFLAPRPSPAPALATAVQHWRDVHDARKRDEARRCTCPMEHLPPGPQHFGQCDVYHPARAAPPDAERGAPVQCDVCKQYGPEAHCRECVATGTPRAAPTEPAPPPECHPLCGFSIHGRHIEKCPARTGRGGA